MLKFVFFATATSLLATGALAQTADKPSWTGPYAGLHVGYGFDDGTPIDNVGNSANNVTAIGNGIRPARIDQNRAGALGGGQIGYNMQRGNIIYGLEGDFSYMHQRGDTTWFSGAQVGTIPAGRRIDVQSDLDWMGSARARLGYSLGRGMIYATGGYAVGRVKGSAEFDGTANAVNYAGGHKYNAQGWIAGGGMEFRPFTQGMMSRVSLGIEATYYDLGRSHIQALSTDASAPGSYTLGVETRGYNGAFKVNYAF